MHWQPGRFLLVDLSYSYVTLRNASDEVARRQPPAHLVTGRLMLPLGNGDGAARHPGHLPERPRSGTGRRASTARRCCSTSACPASTRACATSPACRTCSTSSYALPVGTSTSAPPVPQYGRTFTLQLTGSY